MLLVLLSYMLTVFIYYLQIECPRYNYVVVFIKYLKIQVRLMRVWL